MAWLWVSRNTVNTSWNVKGGGPANDALKFADWLCKRDVPKENIRLCLSSLEENNHLVEQSDLKVEEATEQNLSNIIENYFLNKKEIYSIFFGRDMVCFPPNENAGYYVLMPHRKIGGTWI
jgi:hypothetical protein